MSKAHQFRRLLTSSSTEFAMEAHNGLSSRIVEEAGFKAIWASGLSMSASLGVRDANEASWTQILDVVEFMSDATEIPILLDADTGFGNFNNVRRLVQKLEQKKVAAMCMEDKIFPKMNSFVNGEAQPLADIDEFCGRIRAAKDAQTDENFTVIARIEALIAGRGMHEALERGEAYHKAGADAVLIHSKKKDGLEIREFLREWGGRSPVVIVPTTYPSVPTEVFRDAGVNLIIWANHIMRASITAMQEAARRIHIEESVASVDAKVVPVKEVFRLQHLDELLEAEKRYLPSNAPAEEFTSLSA